MQIATLIPRFRGIGDVVLASSTLSLDRPRQHSESSGYFPRKGRVPSYGLRSFVDPGLAARWVSSTGLRSGRAREKQKVFEEILTLC